MKIHLKLFFIACSLILISNGWVNDNLNSAVIGGWMYLIPMLLDLIDLIIESKKFKKQNHLADSMSALPLNGSRTSKMIVNITQLINSIVAIVAMFSVMSDNELYSIPGTIVWSGFVISYALVGTIIRNFAGIPAKMTHGGWKYGHYRQKRN